MSKGNTFENDVLLLFFNNTNIANVGDATGVRGSTTPGSLYLALHNGDPGEGGSQTTNECTYAGYARVAVARSGAGFTVSGASVVLAANADFPASSSGANDLATHFSIGIASSGTGKILYSGIIGGPYKPFTADTSDLITCPAHGFAADDRIVFEAIEGVSLPTGITQGTRYFVLATGLTTDAFKISATSGGAAIDVTVAGGGLLARGQAISIVGAGVTPRLGTGTTVTEG